MGLDMYLEKKVYVGANYEHRNVVGNIDIMTNGKPIKVNFNKVSLIVEEVGYWRKANAIHNWFVENVQNGDDNCGQYYVSTKKMKELLEVCKTVLDKSKLVKGKIANGYPFNDKGERVYNFDEGLVIEDSSTAKELLPTTDGFFFGSTAYDEYYLHDIEDTIKILEDALKDEDGDFYYSSSW